MKRIGNIYDKIISVENCKLAILDASCHKRNRKVVKKVLSNIDKYAEELSTHLKNLTFCTPYTQMRRSDGLSGKMRDITVHHFFPDQCAHHAIIRVIRKNIVNFSYYWSCSNIKGRGTKRARRAIERFTKVKGIKYCAKFDVKKFYSNINHDVLKKIIRNKIKDKRTYSMFDTLIDSYYPGIPIGTYPSCWFAEMVLNGIDNFIKQVLKVKEYARYADDFVILGTNKKYFIRI